MKKRSDISFGKKFLLILFLLYFSVLSYYVIIKDITGAEGMATSALTQANICVINSPNESCAPTVVSSPPTSGGGGGGGGSSRPSEVLRVSPDPLFVKISQGEQSRQILAITNLLRKDNAVEVDLSEISDFAQFYNGETELNLNIDALATENLPIKFEIPQDFDPGLYNKKIYITSGTFKKALDTIVEINSYNALFDVLIKLEHNNIEYSIKNKELIFELNIFNIKSLGQQIDIKIDYQIRDLSGKVILEEHEYRGLEREIGFLKRIKLPANISPGKYQLYVKTEYNGIIASSSAFFEITKSVYPFNVMPNINILIYLMIYLLLILITIIVIKHMNNLHKERVELIKKMEKKDGS